MAKQKIVTPTDDASPSTNPYETECAAGREMAAALIAEIGETGKTYLLGWRARALAAEPPSGVFVGFSAYIAEKLMEGALLCENLHYCAEG
jgi:hypothetical protein